MAKVWSIKHKTGEAILKSIFYLASKQAVNYMCIIFFENVSKKRQYQEKYIT